MRTAALAALALVACSHPAHGPRTTPRQVEVLMNDAIARAGHVGTLIPDFDVAPERVVVVSDPDHLYAIGWGGAAPIADLSGVDSFTFTSDGLLLAVRGNALVYRDATGTLVPLYTLPRSGMGLATGAADTVYLFDRQSSDGNYDLYELTPGRRIALVFQSPQPIDAVAPDGDRLLFATGGAVFELAEGKPSRLIAHLVGSPLRSVAADAQHVYVSDGARVYTIAGDGLSLVTATAGGSLRVRGGALFVLDPAQHLLVRLAPR